MTNKQRKQIVERLKIVRTWIAEGWTVLEQKDRRECYVEWLEDAENVLALDVRGKPVYPDAACSAITLKKRRLNR
jgi:hypothetical protein